MKKIPTEIYSRVVGYFRPVNQWNEGKQAEFSDRRPADPARIVQEAVYAERDKRDPQAAAH